MSLTKPQISHFLWKCFVTTNVFVPVQKERTAHCFGRNTSCFTVVKQTGQSTAFHA